MPCVRTLHVPQSNTGFRSALYLKRGESNKQRLSESEAILGMGRAGPDPYMKYGEGPARGPITTKCADSDSRFTFLSSDGPLGS